MRTSETSELDRLAHEEVDSYIKLWRAVLEQVLVDALIGSAEALEWFLERESIEYVCDLARLDSRVLVEWAQIQGIEVGRSIA